MLDAEINQDFYLFLDFYELSVFPGVLFFLRFFY